LNIFIAALKDYQCVFFVKGKKKRLGDKTLCFVVKNRHELETGKYVLDNSSVTFTVTFRYLFLHFKVIPTGSCIFQRGWHGI